MEIFSLVIRLIRPLNLFGVVILYWLGAGISHYLGYPNSFAAYALGQAWIMVLLLGLQFLYDFNHFPSGPYGSVSLLKVPGPARVTARTLLLSSFSCLAILAFLTVVMLAELSLSPVIGLLMFVIFGAGFLFAFPAARLELSGYGELVLSVVSAFGIPAFAFLILTGEFHRLIAMSTIPLVGLCLAMLIVMELKGFASDNAGVRTTMVVRMGWKAAMAFHQIIIVGSFFLLILAFLFGLPRFVLASAALAFPVACLQIYQLWQIGQGGRPNWGLFVPNAVATFGFTVYLIGFSFWIN